MRTHVRIREALKGFWWIFIQKNYKIQSPQSYLNRPQTADIFTASTSM